MMDAWIQKPIQVRTVQVDPIKPASKAPRTKPLNLIYDGPLSNFAFKSNLRRYIPEAELLALVDTFIRHSFDGSDTFIG